MQFLEGTVPQCSYWTMFFVSHPSETVINGMIQKSPHTPGPWFQILHIIIVLAPNSKSSLMKIECACVMTMMTFSVYPGTSKYMTGIYTEVCYHTYTTNNKTI